MYVSHWRSRKEGRILRIQLTSHGKTHGLILAKLCNKNPLLSKQMINKTFKPKFKVYLKKKWY